MKKQLKLLLVDFDGVLSNGRFYYLPDSDQKELAAIAEHAIFASQDRQLLHQWMKGELTYGEIHDRLGRTAGVDARELDALLRASIKHMPLNHSLLGFITSLRSRGVTVSLFTNNMDIFDTYGRAYHQLDNHFDAIYSSSQHGQLKLENDTLLQLALSEAGVDVQNTALVDDSHNSLQRATQYGVNTFLYEKYEESQPLFERWLRREYEW
jgi:FMN phosphatase YigB (HAD superfamily)